MGGGNKVARTPERCVKAAYAVRTWLFPAKRRRLSKDYTGQSAASFIRKTLEADRPCMIGRWGATELAGLLSVWDVCDPRPLWQKRWGVFVGEMRATDRWNPRIRRHMAEWSGFFPLTDVALARFAELMESAARELDIVGSWLAEDIRVRHLFPLATVVDIRDLRPEQNNPPWSQALAGRRVLVVHPFEQSIRQQYKKRTMLFPGREVLPEFELLTFKALQTLGGSSDRFANWFDAFDWMCCEIEKINFDVAIIGAGAYGFPLAAFVKRLGRKAVHLGGATQLMFGIMGRRWEKDPTLKPYVNENWARPLPAETPPSAHKVEDGCYW